MPPGIGQSAFVAHGVEAASSQVSHWQRLVVHPPAVQSGLDVVKVRTLVPVVLLRLIGSVAINAPESGGQSRLVEPNETFGDEPLMSQTLPLRWPPEQVPPRTPSLVVPSPMQFGHGLESVMPL